MKISVVGPGYRGETAAGVVSAQRLSRDGHEVAGSDALLQADLILVCGMDLPRECVEVGRALATHAGAPVVVVAATVPPGTMREVVIPVLERTSGRKAGEEFGVCISAEPLRDGSVVIGELNRASGDPVAALYANTRARVVRTDLETAETVKYADGAWQALKAGFANEIGSLCKALGVDAHKVTDIFCRELKPGSFVPDDVRGLLQTAKSLEISLPIADAILSSNAMQIERGVQAVIEKGRQKVGILGFAFPMAELAQRLIADGFEVRFYERVDEALAQAQTIVIGRASPEFADVPRRLGDGQSIIDFARACDSRTILGVYEGICW